MDIEGICDELKSLAAGVAGVQVAAIGINQAWPSTPAVEVIPDGFDLRTLAAGNLEQEAEGTVFLAVYVALSANLEDDERALLPIVRDLVAALRSPSFDRTLGGRVEDTRATSVDFDLVRRNNRSYRSALIQVALGDLATAI